MDEWLVGKDPRRSVYDDSAKKVELNRIRRDGSIKQAQFNADSLMDLLLTIFQRSDDVERVQVEAAIKQLELVKNQLHNL